MVLKKSFHKNEVSCYRSKDCATVRGMDGSMVLPEVFFLPGGVARLEVPKLPLVQ